MLRVPLGTVVKWEWKPGAVGSGPHTVGRADLALWQNLHPDIPFSSLEPGSSSPLWVLSPRTPRGAHGALVLGGWAQVGSTGLSGSWLEMKNLETHPRLLDWNLNFYNIPSGLQ